MPRRPEFPATVIDAQWRRWDARGGFCILNEWEPVYHQRPTSNTDTPGDALSFAALATAHGPLRPVVPMHRDAAAAIAAWLAACGPGMLAVAVTAIQHTAARLVDRVENIPDIVAAGVAMTAARPGSLEAEALRNVLAHPHAYEGHNDPPPPAVRGIADVLYYWVAGQRYVEVAENFAVAVAVPIRVVDAVYEADVDTDIIASYRGAAGWLASHVVDWDDPHA